MKLDNQTLKRIIKEELQATLRESIPSGGTDYYNKLITLMRTKAGVYQAESLYEFARDQLDDEEKTFFENCFKLLELGREATKIGLEVDEISKQIREYVKDKLPMTDRQRYEDTVLQEFYERRDDMREQIRELDRLFDQQSLIIKKSVGRMVKENPRAHAYHRSREAGTVEASGHFGMLSI